MSDVSWIGKSARDLEAQLAGEIDSHQARLDEHEWTREEKKLIKNRDDQLVAVDYLAREKIRMARETKIIST